MNERRERRTKRAEESWSWWQGLSVSDKLQVARVAGELVVEIESRLKYAYDRTRGSDEA